MRIALIPQITIGNVVSDSAFKWATDAAEAFAKRGAVCHILLDASQIDTFPHINGVYYEHVEGLMGAFYGMPPNLTGLFERLHPRAGSLCVDVVYTNQVYLASFLQAMQYDCNYTQRFLVWLDDVMPYSHTSKVTRSYVNATKLGGSNPYSLAELRATSYAYADRILFATRLNYEDAMYSAKRVLAPAVVQSVIDKSLVSPVGIDYEAVEKKVAEYKKDKNPDRLRLFFGGRLNSLKRPEVMIENYLKYFAYGRDVDIVVTSPKDDTQFWERLSDEAKQVVEVKLKLSHEEFLREAALSDIVVYPSKGEGLSYGVLEMILADNVVVLPDLPWVHSMFGDWYPFMVKRNKDLYGAIVYITKHYDECKQKMEKVKEFIRENYDVNDGFDRIWGDMKEKVQDQVDNVSSGSILDLVKEAMGGVTGTISLDDALQLIASKSKSLSVKRFETSNVRNRRYPSKLELSKMITGYCGFSTANTKFCAFVKEEK